MTTPPRIADWLLCRLASGPKRQSLIGDLHEQFQRRQSAAAWYWRQTLRALASSVWWDLRHHPVLAVRTTVLTYVLLVPWVYFTGNVYGLTKWWMIDHVTRNSPLLHDVWVIYSVPLLIAWAFGWALTGWLVASLQSDNRAGTIVIALCAQLPWTVLDTSSTWRLANVGLPFFVRFPMITFFSVVAFGLPLSLIVGGLCAAQTPRVRTSGI